jgi:hypothetical protein
MPLKKSQVPLREIVEITEDFFLLSISINLCNYSR